MRPIRRTARVSAATLLRGAAFALLAGLSWSACLAAGQTGKETAAAGAETARAIFAGGCFWCMEGPFDELSGVLSTTSGYIGGHLKNPAYKQVSRGNTGHTEAVQVVYDPEKVNYRKLLQVFWHNIDPLDAGGQFCDRGSQYRSGIFYLDDEQKRLAIESRQQLDESGELSAPVVTEITAASTFYPAESYHQDFYQKNPLRYKYYRYRCGRDQRLEALWGASH